MVSFLVIEAESPEKVDELSFDLPIMQEIGDQIQIEVIPIIPYHAFANFLYGSVGQEKTAKAIDFQVDPAREGIFYWLVFNVEYVGLWHRSCILFVRFILSQNVTLCY